MGFKGLKLGVKAKRKKDAIHSLDILRNSEVGLEKLGSKPVLADRDAQLQSSR